jgi:type IV secretory pathway TrbL component
MQETLKFGGLIVVAVLATTSIVAGLNLTAMNSFALNATSGKNTTAGGNMTGGNMTGGNTSSSSSAVHKPVMCLLIPCV